MVRFLMIDASSGDIEVQLRAVRSSFKGSRAIVAGNREEFDVAMAKGDFDIVITEYRLPWADGLTVASHVRERYPHVPVIMFTDSGSEDVVVQGMKNGLCDFIRKKNVDRLPASIKECLEKSQQAREERFALDRVKEAEAHYRNLVERIPAVTYITTPDKARRVYYVSPQLESLLGYTMRQWCNTKEMWQNCIHPDDRPRVMKAVAGMVGGCDTLRQEYRLISRDGRVVWVSDDAQMVCDDSGHSMYVHGIMTDITARRHVEEELRLLLAVTMEISAAPDIAAVMETVLRSIGESTGWACGSAWMPSADQSCLECRASWSREGGALREFMAVNEKFTFRAGVGLPGKVWAAKKPMWEKDIRASPNIFRARLAGDAGFKACMAIPVFVDDELLAVLDFFTCEPRDEDGMLMEVVSKVAREVGALVRQKKTEEALRESEERYGLVVQGVNDGIWDWKLASNQVYFSGRWKEMIGYAGSEIGEVVEEWFNLVHPDDLPELRSRIGAHLEGKLPSLDAEYRVLHKDGSWRWMLCRGAVLPDASGRPSRMAGSQTDITRRKEIELQLAHDAMHDPLTGLANRILFMDRLSHAVERAKRHEGCLIGVLYLDVDNLKLVNDRRGHNAGDSLLVRMARAMESCLRPEDTLARMGGDEFAIILDDIKNMDSVTQVADRILESIRLPVKVNAHEIIAGASIGLAIGKGGEEKAEQLLRDADIAMYRAKSAGGGRYEVFDQSMRAQIMERHMLETELKLALERNEFDVYYQPIVSHGNEGGVEVEALLRWRHPERGVLLPSQFMHVAEETGLIVPIGEWVLRSVCLQSKKWCDADLPRIRIMVNVSARQFRSQYIPTLIWSILSETGVAPSALGIEITESIAMQDTDLAVDALTELGAMGVNVSLDDFGTGYSSLAYLKKFPIQSLKIDQSFVRDIPLNFDDMAITSTIVAMAHSMNVRAIAEGVENEDQLAFLKEHQCDGMQGYLFSRPMSGEMMAELLQAHA
ncbi:MAG: EAL domain-containing protein [Nitrospirota bacterium]|nr:EAL domain-containing protein [Nitrospirota bacterium]